MDFNMYPENFHPVKPISLQSRLFGHRIKPSQTKYEYLIEFLQVVIARKTNLRTEVDYGTEMFPVDEDHVNGNVKYCPVTRIGLKRFIFFPKSKMDGKAEVDKEAYNQCVLEIKKNIIGDSDRKKQECVDILQNLLLGFSVDNQNRSWFDQNMLPLCPEVILPEGMGVKTKRKGLKFEKGCNKVDGEFDYRRYTYMCRGGEIYYLHILNAINEFPQYKEAIEKFLNIMLKSFPQFSEICEFVQATWDCYMEIMDENNMTEKTLGVIPRAFSLRNQYTLMELENFLQSKSHPFEKMEIFANGMVLQILRLMYLAAATEKESNCWLIDVNWKGYDEHREIRKLAIASFKHNEEMINNYLYDGLEKWRDQLSETDENKIIKNAATDSYKLFRRLGKTLGIVIPNTGPGIRFSLSEEVIKFLVLALIPPRGMVTMDEFLEALYKHYGMVIDEEQYRKEMERGSVKQLGDLSFLKGNREALAQKLKDCGFLRELSDDISIVENPYESEM